MNVLVVGYGSIGRRHVANLLKLNDIDKIFVFTGVKENIASDNKVQLIDSSSHSIDEILKYERFDFGIIANETYKHIDTAIKLAEKGMHLFIEKPLSHNLDKVETLKEIAEIKKIYIFIAYNLRFLGAILKTKKELEERTIGKPYFAKIEVGQYLPSWRPDVDYRKSYSADIQKGGGVSLDLSHEVDYMLYLFGMPKEWKVFKAKVSSLEINSDDLFEGLYQFDNGFVCNVHMDYLQKVKKRLLRIIGSEGSIKVDMNSKQMEVFTNSERQYLANEGLFDIDQTYIDELHHFIGFVREGVFTLTSLDDGISVLKMLEDSCV